MALNSEIQKKLQVFMVAAIVIAGGRAAYIVYERHEARKEEAKPRQEGLLKPDYYVSPKKLHPYDLKSARQLTAQPVWVKVGYQLTCYPYDRNRRQADFEHEAGTLQGTNAAQGGTFSRKIQPGADGPRADRPRF